MIWAVSLAYTKLRPRILTGIDIHEGIRSLFDRPTGEGAANQSVLYPLHYSIPLSLKTFRGEPAITRFDKLFTPNHKSSDGIERQNGSGLHSAFAELHPAHG